MNALQKFLLGLQHILKGISFLSRHPRLWIYALTPTLINLLLLALMLGSFVHFYGDLYSWLSGFLGHLDIENPTTWYWTIADGLLWIVDKIFQLIVILISLILMLLLFYVAAFVISSPFNDLLSERVEEMVTGHSSPPFSWEKLISDGIRTIKTELVKAAFFLGIPFALLILVMIPIVGASIYSFLTVIFEAFDLGFNYVDYPMGRKLLPFRERIGFAKQHAVSLLGFGLPILVPFANFFLMAPMVVGGTLLYIRLNEGNPA